MSEVAKAESPKTTMISFPRERGGRHPKHNVVIYRIEVTDLAAPPAAADSTICRFSTKEASLSRDACGVTLKLGSDEWFWGYGRLDEVVNVPRGK